MGAEVDEYVIDFPQFTVQNTLAYLIDRFVETADNANIQHLSRLFLHLLHLQRFAVDSGSGLLTKNMLAGTHSVYGNYTVHQIGCTYRNRLDFRILERGFVVSDSSAAAVFVYTSLGLFRNHITKVLDFSILCFKVAGNMR